MFESSLSANRILKTYSCQTDPNTAVSLLDDSSLIQWRLNELDACFGETMKVFNSPIVSCRVPKHAYNSPDNYRNVVSFCGTSPDVKVNGLCGRFEVKSNLDFDSYDINIDNPLTARVRLCELDSTGRYLFIVTEVEEFTGKQLPAEAGFVKLVCTVVEMSRAEDRDETKSMVERFIYVN